MMKRNNSFAPNYLSMLDLLSSALAAVILLFVMTPQGSTTSEEVKALDLLSKETPQKGKKFILKNVHFYGSSALLLPDSEDYVKNELVDYLKQHKNSKFRLIGHSNGLGKAGFTDDKILDELSRFRARAVARLLIVNGIDESRVSYEGRGDKEMIDTVNLPGMDPLAVGGRNRRVELVFE